MGGRIVGFAATFFVPIVLVRIFAPEVFGTYKQLFLIYTTLFALAQIGMAESLFYFLPRDRERSGRYFVNSVALLSLSGLVALGALWLGAPAISSWMGNPELARHLPLLGAYLFLMLASAGLEITLMCGQRYGAAAATYAISDVLRATLLILPAVFTRDLRWLLLGAVAFGAVRVVAEVVTAWRRFGPRIAPDRSLLRRQLGYSMPFQLAVIVEVAQANLHQYAVAYWFDPVTFAIYAVGCLQIPLVELAASSAGNVLMVRMGDALRAGDKAAARRIWTSTTRQLALLLVPMVVVLVLVARDLIPVLFTDAYRAAVPIFVVWTLAVLFGVLQTDSALRVFAAVRTILVLNLVRLAVVGGLIYVAVTLFGLVGAVGVTVLALLLSKALALVRLRRLLGASWRDVLPWRDLATITGVSVLAAVPPLLLRPELTPATFPTLAVLGLVYGVSLVALALGHGVLHDDEIPRVLRPFRRLASGEPAIEPSESA
jgi:O-antigen/teichoic acid export membrane protein